MGETTEPVVQSGGVEGVPSTDGEAANQSTADAGESTPDARVAALEAELARIRTSKRAAEEWKAAREAEDAERERKAALDRGEHEQVLKSTAAELEAVRAELADAKAREDARVERVRGSNDKRTAALPAELRALVPEGLSADAVADHLAKLEALDRSGPTGGTRSHGGSAPEISDECRREAAKHGRDPEWWNEHIWQPRLKRKAAS